MKLRDLTRSCTSGGNVMHSVAETGEERGIGGGSQALLRSVQNCKRTQRDKSEEETRTGGRPLRTDWARGRKIITA